jgi:hypothetical protein
MDTSLTSPAVGGKDFFRIILPLDGRGLRWGWILHVPLTLTLSHQGRGRNRVIFEVSKSRYQNENDQILHP